ncbi:MAG: N-acetylmuramoyl-L-alanine amidase [Sneathiella sp.]|nr:N-acetylmuramoyl-L-alanine amidase [Sneathiella sp.]
MSVIPIQQHPSPNFNDRRNGDHVTILVLHYTGMQSGEAALERLCDPAAEVSAHYLVEEDGRIFQLVDELKRAWHAGVGYWRGERDINSRSIGIEIVNPGHEFGYRAFPEAQMKAVEVLAAEIVTRHSIAPINVIGHSDLAPLRKEDPGELFDWARLARQGVGIWGPADKKADPTMAEFLADLEAIGYDMEDEPSVIVAFQRHWAPRQLHMGGNLATRQAARGLVNSLLT